MTGMSLFLHSVRQVFGNFNAAVQISIPAAVMMAIMYLMAPGLTTMMVDPSLVFADQSSNYLFVFLGMVALITGILWTAVAWHRYILREEAPAALPAFHGSAMLNYLGWSIMLGVIMALVGMLIGGILGIVLGVLGFGLEAIARWAPILVIVPVTYLTYRLSLILPARALGDNLRLEQSWKATEAASNAILGLSVIALAVGIVVDLFLMPLFVGRLGATAALVFFLLYQWVYMMVGISILSTLYGVCIENRTLVGASD